jgi:4-amino-4-deoxy-L-arabinose transferase-like glycosyltransferase
MIFKKQHDKVLEKKASFPNQTFLILAVIIFCGAVLRLYNLRISPPGLNQDEATNAWNAYCLLKTSKDQAGVSWPIFYTRGLGGNNTTLFIYLLIPFQLIGGMNVITTRLLAAVGGIATILLIYYVGKKMFDRWVGLAAAGFLAFNPWNIQQSRWGHEASLCALYGLVPLAVLLWANIPICRFASHSIKDNQLQEEDKPARPIVAGIGGALAGICCYGYHAVRIFVPFFIFGIFVVTLPNLLRGMRNRRTALAIVLFAVMFSATFGPLAWKHITDPEGIGRHAKYNYLWDESDSTATKVQKVLSRYIEHFGLDFLFVRGDHYLIQAPPGTGQFHWYMLPVMAAGMAIVLWQFNSSLAARVLLVYILTYPLGDCFSHAISMHALRSMPGLCSLILLGAVGAVIGVKWLWKQSHIKTSIIIAVFTLAFIGLNIRFFYNFYVSYNKNPGIYHAYHTDLLEACYWLKDKLDETEAFFWTTNEMNQPYIMTLVGFGYEPKQWFNDKRDIVTPDEWDYYKQYGKMYFIYDNSQMPLLGQILQKPGRKQIFLIIRPDEIDLKQEPVKKIYAPTGEPSLLIYKN